MDIVDTTREDEAGRTETDRTAKRGNQQLLMYLG